jgi:ATP-binding cassette subfamily C protein
MPASIRANVAFGLEDREIDDEAVWSALRRASLAEFVQRLPGDLHYELGDQGVGVSGGQRQRLSIARALYHDPRVLILDEATSSLDVETEAEITRTLSTLTGLTKIVVAHRLSTVREADQVLFLRDGHVEARGTFESVRQAVPDFARQVQLSGLSAD